MSTEIIKGGAYKRADGTWVNAKGKSIPEPKGEVYQVEPEAEGTPEAPAGGEEFGAASKVAKPGKKSKAGG